MLQKKKNLGVSSKVVVEARKKPKNTGGVSKEFPEEYLKELQKTFKKKSEGFPGGNLWGVSEEISEGLSKRNPREEFVKNKTMNI